MTQWVVLIYSFMYICVTIIIENVINLGGEIEELEGK